MPLLVNADFNVWNVNHQTPSEKRIVKKLIVDNKEVWNEPQAMSERITITTGTRSIVDTSGIASYPGHASVNIGLYRKQVSVSAITFGNPPSVSYDSSTGIASISVSGRSANQKIICTIKYYT